MLIGGKLIKLSTLYRQLLYKLRFDCTYEEKCLSARKRQAHNASSPNTKVQGYFGFVLFLNRLLFAQ